MDVRAAASPPDDADTVVVLLRPGDDVPPPLAAAGARTKPRRLTSTWSDGRRWIAVGLGEDPGAEDVRMAAAVAVPRAREMRSGAVHLRTPVFAGAAVEGWVMGAYRFTRFKSDPPEEPDPVLTVSGDPDEVAAARIAAVATNAARDLQEAPPNEATPEFLGRRALALAAEYPALRAEVHGRDFLLERGMGCFAAIAQGSALEPALIVLRYEPPGGAAPGTPVLGFVGKGVTWDSGGYSLKSPASMPGQKYDMSGGAAVIEALGAIAALALPVPVIGVVGATDNMVSGGALRPGDVVRAANGVTVEVTNTDAEGRMVLADCLVHARSLGAERLVDIATLTGGVVSALGIHLAGLLATDDEWAQRVLEAGEAVGEPSFRLPLLAVYDQSLESKVADTLNSNLDRKAHAIVAARFLLKFVGDVPWAHLDIAGTAEDRGKPYAKKGGAGFGVRTLVELARRSAIMG